MQGALDALIGAGYNSPYISRHQADLKQLMRGIWKVVLHRRCESGVIATIELHWAPFSPRTFPLDEYLVWRHMGQVSFHGPMIRVPDPELTVLLLACHVAQSGLAQEQMLADLAAAWDRFHDELDSETLFGLIQGARARAAFGYAMAVAGRRGMIGSAVPSSNAPQTQWALKSWPMGRIRKTSTNADSDYQGQLAALTLCHPTRVLPEIARIGFPSRGAIAVAGNIAMPGRITYLVESYRRLIRIGKSLAG